MSLIHQLWSHGALWRWASSKKSFGLALVSARIASFTFVRIWIPFSMCWRHFGVSILHLVFGIGCHWLRSYWNLFFSVRIFVYRIIRSYTREEIMTNPFKEINVHDFPFVKRIRTNTERNLVLGICYETWFQFYINITFPMNDAGTIYVAVP